EKHSDARIETDHCRCDANGLACNDAGASGDVEDPIGFLQAGAGQHLPAIPAAGSEGQKSDRPVVPRRGSIEEILHEPLSIGGPGVELLQRRMRSDRRQRVEPISSKIVSGLRRSPRAYAASMRRTYSSGGSA